MTKGRVWTVLKIAATYAGTIMGAGFASGQELNQFFAVYGKTGMAGLLLAGILFSWLGAYIMNTCARLQVKNYTAFLYFVCGKRLGRFLDGAVACFLFSILTVMLAGAGTLGRDMLEIPFMAGVIVFSLLLMGTTLRGLAGITAANLIITPLLTAATLSVVCTSLDYHYEEGFYFDSPSPSFSLTAPHWLVSALLYVSYNLVMALTVLIPMGMTIPQAKLRLAGCFAGGILLTFLASLVSLAVIIHYPHILNYEIPMLYLAGAQHRLQEGMYLFILSAAMFTSALASLFGCAGKLQTVTGWPYFSCLLLPVAAALLFSQAGFSSLIALLFPLFGYITLIFTLRLTYLSLFSR